MRTRLRILYTIATLILARVVAALYRPSDLWLIAEKIDEARDNGYWFYRYLNEQHPDFKVRYIIKQSSADFERVAKYGKVKLVKPNSFRHKVLYWAARYQVTSQPIGDYFQGASYLKCLKKKQQVNVFLQHGITKDNLDHSLDYPNAGIDIFITAAHAERKAIMSWHRYDDKHCVLTGFCRFDNLKAGDKKSKQILLMPTFRHWLMCQQSDGIPTEEEIMRFKNDSYFRSYDSLLSSYELQRILSLYGYNLIFYPHYCAQPFLKCFDNEKYSNQIILASKQTHDVQALLKDADILITDFSSVFFDFAYMKKPEIFYQFDVEQYRGDHYKEGYFNYERDAFGLVVGNEKGLLQELESILQRNCTIESKYLERIEDFFPFTDQMNCERTFGSIIDFKH